MKRRRQSAKARRRARGRVRVRWPSTWWWSPTGDGDAVLKRRSPLGSETMRSARFDWEARAAGLALVAALDTLSAAHWDAARQAAPCSREREAAERDWCAVTELRGAIAVSQIERGIPEWAL